MKLVHKRIVKESTARLIRPARIQAEFVAATQLPVSTELPTLAQIQRVAYHYRKSIMLEDAYVDKMNARIAENQYEGSASNSSIPFAFGFSINSEGVPSVGRGSDNAPFIVGITTQALIRRLEFAEKYPLHVDATFKLNKSHFPLTVFGVSDMKRSFHPVAFFIMSQLTIGMYERATTSLLDMYKHVTGKDARVRYVMTDGDDALHSAITVVYAQRNLPRPVHLMCWFHVVMNVKKRAQGLTKTERKGVKDLLYRMHYSRSEAEFTSYCVQAETRWGASSGSDALRKFSA
jgi:hypothetical protein